MPTTCYARSDPPVVHRLAGTNGQIAGFLPSFAGRPGVRLSDVRLVNPDVAYAAVLDDDGEQTTAITVGRWIGRLLPDQEIAPTEAIHAAYDLD